MAALLSMSMLLPTAGAGAAETQSTTDTTRPAPVVPRQLIANQKSVLVRFKPGTQAASQDKLLKKHSLLRQRHFASANVEVVKVSNNELPDDVVAALRKSSDVEFAERDYAVQPSSVSADSLVDSMWGLANGGQTVAGQPGVSGVDVKANAAWGTSTGQGVIVGVLDQGVDISHPELASHIWHNTADCYSDGIDHDHDGYVNDCSGWDFYHGDNSVFDAADGDSHGTHVAGTIAASLNNGIGGAGVAPNVTIMPLKFLGPSGGSTSDAIAAIEFAKAHGVRVMNCSWGGSAYSQALRDAMADSGITFAVAAGNSGVDIAQSPQYPAAFDLPNLISVAAIDNRGALASFSNRGGNTSLGAPGVSILSTIPRKAPAVAAIDNAPSSGTYKSAFWGFGLEAVVGAPARATLLHDELVRLGASSPNSPITLVDDDESSSSSLPDVASYYYAALLDAGYDPSAIEVKDVTKDQPGPAEGTMHGRTVIWETGYATGSQNTPPLHSVDLAQLTTFLNGGGKALVAGSDAIWRNETSQFVRIYLGVDFQSEGDTRTAVSGINSTYSGVHIDLSGADSPRHTQNQYEDTVIPYTVDATPALQRDGDANYDNAYDYKSGTSMAAPHVAGVAALVASILPEADAATVSAIVENTTTPLASLQGVTRTGGMVSAAGAVAQAAELAAPPTSGYRFVASDGGIFAYGTSNFQGSTGSTKLNRPVVGMASTPSGNGYWLVASDGGIFAFGDGAFLGSAGGTKLNQPIVGIAATPTGRGYWLVASDGGIFAYGDANFYGSTGAIKLNQPIVGISSTPSGNGYWLVASDGGIFSFGDAGFYGSTGAIKLNQPIVGIAKTPDGAGYALVARDGGIFSFGDSNFYGSTGAIKLNQPIVGATMTDDGAGYWLAARDGGIFAFGNARFYGSTGAKKLNDPIVAISH